MVKKNNQKSKTQKKVRMVWLLEILDPEREFARGDTQVFKCPLITSRF